MAHQENSASIHNVIFPEWQPQYQAALLESNPEPLAARVMAAEEAIYQRSQQLGSNPDGDAERRAIADAMRALRVIQVEKLGYPEWNKK